jgi:anti-sigma factor RsiW
VVDLALEYLRKELAPEDSRRLDQHLERCPSCINFIRTYEAVPNVTRELLQERMPEAMKSSLMEYLRQQLF